MICAEIALLIGLYTTHMHDNAYFNNDNNVIGMSCDNWTYINFDNSYNVQSHMFGYSFETDKNNFIGAGLIAGYVKGYEDHLKLPLDGAAALPYLRVGPFIMTGVPGEMFHASVRFGF